MVAPVMAQEAATPSESVPASSVEVLRLALTTKVDKQEPVDEITSAKVGEVVTAFSQIRSGLAETSITHRWALNGQTVSDVPLAVKGSPWRTWSRKTLHAAGAWTVQVLNANGDVLKEAKLDVQP